MKFKAGQKIRARMTLESEPVKIHIEHVLEVEKCSSKLIVYRVYGKHLKYWHYFSCYDYEMEIYIKHCRQ